MTASDCYGAVVIGRNEGERLRRSLESVLKLTHRVVYVDSASTDDSVAVARSLGALVVALDAREPLNAARGRNAGVAALRMRFPECVYVLFMDGDCLLVESFPEKALSFLNAHEKVAIACGRTWMPGATASVSAARVRTSRTTRKMPGAGCRPAGWSMRDASCAGRKPARRADSPHLQVRAATV